MFYLSHCCNAQALSVPSKLTTSRFAGTYSFGADIEKGPIGTIIVYPETDKTILFYIYVNRGAPSYNMGSLYGRVTITQDSGIFYTKFKFAEQGCKLRFKFWKTTLAINTLDDQYDCGFGFHVLADGDYKPISNKVPDYFEDVEGTKVFFKATKPEEYRKD